jgi:hypothetical protein
MHFYKFTILFIHPNHVNNMQRHQIAPEKSGELLRLQDPDTAKQPIISIYETWPPCQTQPIAFPSDAPSPWFSLVAAPGKTRQPCLLAAGARPRWPGCTCCFLLPARVVQGFCGWSPARPRAETIAARGSRIERYGNRVLLCYPMRCSILPADFCSS